jgi:hypothetical protein
LIKSKSPPTVVRLFVERPGDFQVPGRLHGLEITEMLTLQQFGRVIV